ncbi:hypothetical protein F5Y18DRAFT_74504 [Xylariaceae sp. FL1019]|nr:hypothetical protein F5Y18DRAFT_74504 [Xylariaceae sp. FL1019]
MESALLSHLLNLRCLHCAVTQLRPLSHLYIRSILRLCPYHWHTKLATTQAPRQPLLGNKKSKESREAESPMVDHPSKELQCTPNA